MTSSATGTARCAEPLTVPVTTTLEDVGSSRQCRAGSRGRLQRGRRGQYHAVAVRNDGFDCHTFQKLRQCRADGDGPVNRAHPAVERQKIRRVGEPYACSCRETVERITERHLALVQRDEPVERCGPLASGSRHRTTRRAWAARLSTGQ